MINEELEQSKNKMSIIIGICLKTAKVYLKGKTL